MEAGRRGGKEANYVSVFCAHSDQSIIRCFRGFIHSIFCSLPPPSLPSGSQRGEKNSQPSTKLQVALKYFTAKTRGGGTSYAGKQVRKGLPRGDWFRLEDSKLREARAASSRRWPVPPALGHSTALPRSWRRGAEAAAAEPQGRDPAAPSSARRHRALSSLLPYSTPPSAPSPSLSLAFPAAKGFRCPTAV